MEVRPAYMEAAPSTEAGWAPEYTADEVTERGRDEKRRDDVGVSRALQDNALRHRVGEVTQNGRRCAVGDTLGVWEWVRSG